MIPNNNIKKHDFVTGKPKMVFRLLPLNLDYRLLYPEVQIIHNVVPEITRPNEVNPNQRLLDHMVQQRREYEEERQCHIENEGHDNNRILNEYY